MKNFIQVILSKTALMAVVAVAVTAAFAGAIIVAPSSSDIAPMRGISAVPSEGIVAASGATIPKSEGPAVAHAIATNPANPGPSDPFEFLGNPNRYFPYRLNLEGINLGIGTAEHRFVTAFHLYIVDTETREIITPTAGNLGPALHGGPASAGTSARGPFIELPATTTPPPAWPGAINRTFGEVVINLRHGQEVMILAMTNTCEGLSSIGGLVDFVASSFFWIDGNPPVGFNASSLNPDETPGFTGALRDYTFSLGNPRAPWPLPDPPPYGFSPTLLAPSPEARDNAEGFSFATTPAWLMDWANPDRGVRIEAVWSGHPSAQAVVNVAKVVDFSTAATTAIDSSFEFTFDFLRFYEQNATEPGEAATPTVANPIVAVPAGTIDVPVTVPAVITDFDRPGTFVFNVTEIGTVTPSPWPPHITNVAYSTSVFEVTVVVNIDVEDHLYVADIIISPVGTPDANFPEAPPETVVFTNTLTYTSAPLDSVEATVPLTKVIDFSSTATTDVAINFEFEVTPIRFYAPSATESSGITTPAVDSVIVDVSTEPTGPPGTTVPLVIAGLDRPGTFVFEVTEAGVVAPGLPAGVTEDSFSDAVFEIIIEVIEVEGELVVVNPIGVILAGGTGTNFPLGPPAVLGPVFTNVLIYTPYIPTPPLDSVETTIAIEKILEVSTESTVTIPNMDFVFEFAWYGVSEPATLTADVGISTAVVNPPGTAFMNFGEMELVFDEAGTFVFIVTERQPITATLPADMNMIYSPAEYKVTVVVVNNDGVLEIGSIRVDVITADPNGPESEYFYLTGSDELVFTNILTDEAQVCEECGEYPCICPPYCPPCDICGECPCICDPQQPGQPCAECDEYPCVCEDYDPGRAPGDEDERPGADGDDRRPAAGPQTGDYSNPAIHVLHMLVAAVVVAVVLHRFTCPSEALARAKR